jgi:nucleotide-binding universal stress UspA family protein
MERGLVTLKDTEAHRELLAEAGEYAEAVGAELVLLWFISEEDYEQDIETLESVGRIENVSYDADAVIESAAADARRLTEDILNDNVPDMHVVVAIDEGSERAKHVINAGHKHDCDHAFVVGQTRSPTGKAIFGDFAQRVILNFDGYVTVATE